ncbi:hypothetical protein SNEBB_001459 [Seison nebaliae]|nr:hypothetical protein SNEBB_001459 [Seison nebaliae]
MATYTDKFYENLLKQDLTFKVEVDWIKYSNICNRLPKKPRSTIHFPSSFAGTNIHLAKYLTEPASWTNSKISSGGQGSTFLIKQQRKRTIYKTMSEVTSFIIELNALKAYEYHPLGFWHNFRVISYSKKKLNGQTETKSISYTSNFTIDYQYPIGQFCLEMTYVNGVELYKDDDYIFRLHSNIKEFYIFVILLLKQIQAIHFTLNEHKITDFRLHQRASYANSHDDIHCRNILVTKNSNSNKSKILFDMKIPILIDPGISSSFLYTTTYDIIGGFYNFYLRKESDIKQLNIIRKGRLLTSGQGIDFCTLGYLFANAVTGDIKQSRPKNIKQCLKLKKLLGYKEHTTTNYGRTTPHINLMNDKELKKILPLLELMFSSMLQFQTFNVWLGIVKFFDPYRNEQIPILLN